ncbi:MAG: hypothetical protein QM765_13910 [Myxococcales bacterium]
MEARRLAQLPAPQYPTRSEVTSEPALLEKAMPAAWRRDELFAAVAAFAVAANTACSPTSPGSAASPATPPASASPASASPAATASPASAAEGGKAIVAPVTSHGEGFATTGCDVVAPPVFLSEDEAIKVIKDEAAKRGLMLTAVPKPIVGVGVTRPTNKADDYSPREMKPFVPDLADEQHGIALEFVSEHDEFQYRAPEAPQGLLPSLIYRYQTKTGAQALSERVAAKASQKVFFGALYDPAGATRDTERKKTANRELLRLQVVDFLDWLKAQGAL